MPRKKTTPEETMEQLEQPKKTPELPEAEAAFMPQTEAPDTPSEDAPVPEVAASQENAAEDDSVPEIISVELIQQDADEGVDYSLAADAADGSPVPDTLEQTDGNDEQTEAAPPASETEPAPENTPTEDGPAEADSTSKEPAAEAAPTPRRRTPARRKTAASEAQAAPAEAEKKSFWQLDFHELDRDLSPDERQEWNSIYASFRGRSAITGTVVGIDRHAINVRDRASGQMVRQEMYCAIVIPFRVRIVIPETER